MLYVLRLSSGDCIIVDAQDQSTARELGAAYGLQEGELMISGSPAAEICGSLLTE